MICRFVSVKHANIAYVKLHILKFNGNNYLLFDEYNDIFINSYDKGIKFKDLEEYLKEYKKQAYYVNTI